MLKGLEKSIVRINADIDCFFGKRRESGENKRELGENKGLFQLFLYIELQDHLPLTIQMRKGDFMKKKSKYTHLLDEYPKVITKDQFYRICNISKKTAKHLLDHGLVPCINNGKKTRKYKIKMTDVIYYLEGREISPESYIAPVGWYKTGSEYRGHKREPKVLTEEARNQLAMVYSHRMAYFPDVLNVVEVSDITGYHRNSVGKWCNKKLVHCFNMGNRYLIPKPSLLEFMLSPYFQGLKSKID